MIPKTWNIFILIHSPHYTPTTTEYVKNHIVTCIFFIAALQVACNKNAGVEKSFLQNNVATQLVRFKDSVYTGNQLFISRNILYRDSLKDFAATDSMRRSLQLDFYCPDFSADTMALRPVIVWVHGGSFVTGDKNYDSNLCKTFAKYGYATVSIDYRVNPSLTAKNQNNALAAKELYETIYRQVQDTRFAIRFIKNAQNAALGRIDTNRVFLAGLSAGAVIALHSAWLSDRKVNNQFIDQAVLGKLDYGGIAFKSTAGVNVVIAFAGALTDLSVIEVGSTPAICLHSTGDTFFPVDCGAGSLYKQIYFCGGRSVAGKLTALGIPNAFKQFNDPLLPVPPASLSHGSVVAVPGDPSSGQLNPVGIQFMTDNLYAAFFSH